MSAIKHATELTPLPPARATAGPRPDWPAEDLAAAVPAALATPTPPRAADAADMTLEFWYFCDEGSAFRSG